MKLPLYHGLLFFLQLTVLFMVNSWILTLVPIYVHMLFIAYLALLYTLSLALTFVALILILDNCYILYCTWWSLSGENWIFVFYLFLFLHRPDPWFTWPPSTSTRGLPTTRSTRTKVPNWANIASRHWSHLAWPPRRHSSTARTGTTTHFSPRVGTVHILRLFWRWIL